METGDAPRRPRASRRRLLLGAVSAAALGVTGCSGDGAARAGDRPSTRAGAPGAPAVELWTRGDELRPVVELASEAEVSWLDLDTGTVLGTGEAPVLAVAGVRRVGLQVTAHGADALDRVLTLNLGFDRDDDYGRLSLPAAYEHDAQPVTAVAGLSLLSGLLRFCAAGTPLTGPLDLSGLHHLEHVECYGCDIDAVDLTGCSSLVRLCVERCRLSELDLGPVRRTLSDLRAALQRSDGLTFAPLDGPMEALHHYCVRDQPVHRPVPHHQLPVIEEYWVWATGQRSCDPPTSPLLTSFLARDNPYDQASVDAVLVALHTLVTDDDGRVDLSGRAPDGTAAMAPSPAGAASASALLAAGWRVSTN